MSETKTYQARTPKGTFKVEITSHEIARVDGVITYPPGIIPPASGAQPPPTFSQPPHTETITGIQFQKVLDSCKTHIAEVVGKTIRLMETGEES